MKEKNFETVVRNNTFRNALAGTVKFLLKPFTFAVPTLEFAEDSGFCTNGNRIHLGIKDALIDTGKTFQDKMNILLGAVYHECAHCCFFEMGEFTSFIHSIDHPKINMSLVTETYDRDEVDALITDIPSNTQIIGSLYHGFMNIVRDVHDEKSLIAYYGMMVERPIMAIRTAMKRGFATYEDDRADSEKSPTGNFSLALNLMLYFARFDELNLGTNASLRDPICVSVLSLKPIIDEATGTDDTQEQIACITVMIARLWGFLKPKQQDSGEQESSESRQSVDNQQSPGDQQQSGNGQQNSGNQKSDDEQQNSGDQQSGNGQQNTGEQQSSDEQQSSNGQQSGNGQQSTGNQQPSDGQQSSNGQQSGNSQQNTSEQPPSDGQQSSNGQPFGNGQQTMGNQQPNGEQQSSNGQQTGNGQQNTGSQQQSGNGKQHSGSQQTEAEKQAQREQLEKIISEALGKIADEKSSLSDDSRKKDAAAEDSGERAKTAESILQKALKDSVSEAEAEDAIAEEQQASKTAVETADRTDVHYIPCSDSCEPSYRTSMERVSPVVRSAVRTIRDSLREENSSPLYGRSQGTFSVRSLPKSELMNSGKAFEIYKVPDEIPEMAIGVLIDHSGSMWGQKLYTAQTMAIMLYEIAKELGIRIHIAGFDYSGDETNYIEYIGFEDYRKPSMRYRLGSMAYYDGCCNRDGAAIRAITKVMSGRKEKRKICYILSDGEPSAYMSRDAGKADIIAAIREAQKKDISIIGCAIDEIDAIRDIYGSGNNFLDMTDLSKVPKRMARQLERLILD